MRDDAYRDFCATRDDIPVFMKPHWLDAVCGSDAWQGLLASDDSGVVRGAWAIHVKRKMGMHAIILPPLTFFTGIWLDVDMSLPVDKQIDMRHVLLADLESQLPAYTVFEQKFHHPLQDWLPFYWRGYRQETRYTYRFAKVDMEVIGKNVSKSFRRNLRRADRIFSVEVSKDVPAFYSLVREVFDIRKESIPFTQHTVEKIFGALHGRDECRIYKATEPEGASASIMVVWDATTTYYILGGRKGSNTRGATNLLIWAALEDAAQRGHAFDFEGSMIGGVNRFFRSFGAEMVPYLYVYKYNGLAAYKYLTH